MRLLCLFLAGVVTLTACGTDNTTASATSDGDGAAEPTPTVGADTGADELEPSSDGETDDRASEPDTGDPAAVADQRRAAAATAEANQADLVVGDAPEATEVLVMADGSVTTLGQAAEGDRPLLVWFWAPH